MFADLGLENCELKDFVEKNLEIIDKIRERQLSDSAICHELTPSMEVIIAEQDGIFSPSRNTPR